MELERGLFLAGAFATHAFVGYALVRGLTDEDPRIGLVFRPSSLTRTSSFPRDWNGRSFTAA